jgi:PAS domain S-box-containing protein
MKKPGIPSGKRNKAEEALRLDEIRLEALQQSEQKFKRLIEMTDTGYVILDDQGRVADANLEYLRMTGRQRLDEILGHSVLEWTASNDLERNDRAMRKCLARGFVRSLEIDYVAPDGRVTPIEINATVLRAAGKVQILTMCRDITDRKRAEDALRESEYFFKESQRAAFTGSYKCDFTADCWESSEVLDRIFGIDRNYNRNVQSWLDIVHPEDRGMMDRYLREEVISNRKPFRKEYRIIRKSDGEVRWVNGLGEIKFDIEGNVISMIGTIRDITDRKQAEEALRKAKDELEQRVAERTAELSQSQARLATLFRTSPAAVFLSRMEDGRFLAVNDACLEILGYSSQEMIGRTSLELNIFVNPDDRQRAAGVLQRDGRIENMEVQFRHRSGEPRILLTNALPLDVDGVPCILGTLLNITERKRAENSLRRSEEMLNLIFRHSSDGINVVEFDPKMDRRKLVLCNDRYVEMSGYTREQLMAAEDLNLLSRANDDDEKTKEYYDKIVHGVPITGQSSWFRPDGKENYYEWTACSTREEGKIFIVGVDRDITERKRVEEELKKANLGSERSASRLRALTLELTRVEHQERRRIAGLLHDHLQQLLVAAKLNVASMAQSKLEERDLDSAHKATVALDQAIAQSKSLAVELNPPILREGGLARALEWLGRRMRQTHDMAVKVEAQDDGGRIDQDSCIVLFNAVRELLLNVLKHANVKSARVEMSMPRGRKVRIVVTDRGSGFASKVTGSANDFESGLGLLAIRERLDSLGGAMEIESRPGKGSRITLTASLRQSAQPARTSPARRPKVRVDRTASSRIKGDAAQKGIRVLLVDDHAIVRQGVAQLLSGVPEITVVAEASNGKEAIQLTRKWRPDVVVMDINMPEMNGVEATRAIHAKWPKVAVIGLSMYHEPHRAKEMRQAGAVGYVNKSDVTETLISTIRACCKR